MSRNRPVLIEHVITFARPDCASCDGTGVAMRETPDPEGNPYTVCPCAPAAFMAKHQNEINATKAGYNWRRGFGPQ